MVWPLSRSAPQTLSSWPFPDNPFHHSRFYTESKADLAARVSTDFQVTSESFFGLRGGKWGELFIRRESSVLTHALPYLLTSGCLHYLSLQRQKYKPAVWWNCAHSSVNPPPHTHTHTHTHTLITLISCRSKPWTSVNSGTSSSARRCSEWTDQRGPNAALPLVCECARGIQ